MFHYSLVSGGREFQPVCLAVKGTIGQIISSSQALLRNEASPPSSKDIVPSKPWLVPSAVRNKTQIPQILWGEGGWAAKQAEGLLPMDLQ